MLDWITNLWPCGPSTCGLGGWLYDFQNLIAGILALAAGVGAYLAGRYQGHAALAAAERQIRDSRSQRAEDAANRANEVRKEQTQIAVAIQTEYIQRASELQFLLTEADTQIRTTLEPRPPAFPGWEKALDYFRTVETTLLHASTGRCREFIGAAHAQIAGLPAGDHAQFRLSLASFDGALIAVERTLEEIAHTGGPAIGVIQIAVEELPQLVEKLDDAKNSLPTSDKPSPLKMPTLPETQAKQA